MPWTPPERWADVPAAVRAALAEPFEKAAADGDGLPVLSHLADVAGWRAGGPVGEFWGGPRPLATTIVGAGLGGLGGYGLGRLAQAVLPERYFDHRAVKRRAAALGAALGAAPGIWQMTDNVRATGEAGSVLDRWPTQPAAEEPDPAAAPDPLSAAAARELTAGLARKVAADLFAPVIDRERFNRDVMAFDGTPMPVRAATAGLVEAASATAGNNWVSPWDVARIALGAGAGLVSGVVAGKALGFLAGLTPAGQEAVQRVGLWTGLLSSAVPKALGLR